MFRQCGCCRPLGEYICKAAARHGEFAFLQWSHKRGAVIGETEIARAAGAAGSNQLDMLLYLQSMIRPELWDGAAADALAVAKQHGHLQSVIWLREHAGAVWPTMLCPILHACSEPLSTVHPGALYQCEEIAHCVTS